MKRKLLLGLLMLLGIFNAACASTGKVLYVTHEPGKWHKYTPQLEKFKEIGERAKWDVTVWTGEHHAQVEKLKTPDFGLGYDAIVYNFCFASARDLEACNNLMNQTRKNGVPAMLIHCSMHSFWGTYKPGRKSGIKLDGKVHSDPKLFKEWGHSHSDEAFPVWGDFTGVASTGHGPKKPVVVVSLKDHPATARLGDGYTTKNTELYNNYYVLDKVIPLVKGTQGKATATIMWECPQGKSKVMGLSLGHDVTDWEFEPFQNMLIDGVNYMIANPKN